MNVSEFHRKGVQFFHFLSQKRGVAALWPLPSTLLDIETDLELYCLILWAHRAWRRACTSRLAYTGIEIAVPLSTSLSLPNRMQAGGHSIFRRSFDR